MSSSIVYLIDRIVHGLYCFSVRLSMLTTNETWTIIHYDRVHMYCTIHGIENHYEHMHTLVLNVQ